MKHTFFLKESKSDKETLIYFSCYFNFEKKKFKYSTGEKVLPEHWDFQNNLAITKGSKKSKNARVINLQLSRYTEIFEKVVSIHKKIDEILTSQILRSEFNLHFKKNSNSYNNFFKVYDEFTSEKIKRKEWKPATIKRYKNIKNHLIEFEKNKGYKLTFSIITERFYTDFTDYCYTTLNHSTNTFARNVGLLKTFLYWAFNKKHTYRNDFIHFKKPERVITDEIALTIDQVKAIFDIKPKSQSLERARDVFVFQCLTGLRYGELKLVGDASIRNNVLSVKEEKDISKQLREVPLNDIAVYILKKYRYRLPIISNQKQNDLIKKVFQDAKFDFNVSYTRNKNKEVETIIQPFYDRISTHTARRTFITIMKKKGIADKTIMKMTGHKDLKTFNTYYKVDTEAKIDAIKIAFGSMELPKLKKA